MKVRYSYLEEQFKDNKEIFEKINDEVIKTGDYTLGKPVDKFEKRFASKIGSRYAIGVNSGTDALFLSLKALNIGQNDEVITSPNTFIATVGAIVAAGARPVFVDITDEYVINPELIEKAITKHTKAIMPVHYAGVPADMNSIKEIAERYNLSIVEDSCQAISAQINNTNVGTIGQAGGFSLHPLKNINVWGDSGVIVTNEEAIRDKLLLLRNHGLRNRDEVDIYGYNSRLDSIQAVVGDYMLDHLDWITNKRIEWAEKLDSELSKLHDYIQIPERKKNKRYVHHLYIIVVKERNKLLKYLNDNGIEAKIHYPIPMHLQKCASKMKYKYGDFPKTEFMAENTITLPVHQHLDKEQIDYMIYRITDFYKKI